MPRPTKMSESPAPNLYGDIYNATPEPYPSRHDRSVTARESPSVSPSLPGSTFSDKENGVRSDAREKGKGPVAMPPPKLPTPLSDPVRAPKRKRGEDRETDAGQLRRRRTAEPQDDESSDDFDNAYDPEQSMEERRKIRQGLRNLTKDLNENRTEYLDPNSTGLIDTLNKANEIVVSVRQTADATIDSRLLVTTADLSYKKAVQLTLGDSVQGVDVDEFVSKCITFMRRADGAIPDGPQAPPSGTQRRRRRQTDDDDLEGDEGDMLNWEALGRLACLQNNARPAVPGFLLGPLSLEKRARKAVQRSQALKHSQLKQTQPEVVTLKDIETNENSNLTVLCSRILGRLKKVQRDGEAAVEKEASDDMSREEIKALMDRHGVHERGGVDLMKFVVNPYSFGQTIENVFYVSFLIRDGKAGITIDDDGIPAVEATEPRKRDNSSDQGDSKHQAILAMDMESWKELIDIFDIREPMIPHREEENEVETGGRGWYS